MIEMAIFFLVQKLEALLRRELKLPKKISDGISSMKGELNNIIEFLEHSEKNGVSSNQYAVFTQEIRDLAYEIEDILDTYSFHLVAEGWWTRFSARHSINSLLGDIHGKIQSIHQKKQRYKEVYVSGPSSSINNSSDTYNYCRIAPLFVDDNADIVGIENPINKITSWIHGRPSSYKAVFVVGMGGSGKTTLARQVYKMVNDGFDCYAWIITSGSSKKHKVLSTILTKLKDPIDNPTPQIFNNFNVVDLMENIKHYLQGKRYIIVIDGLQVKEIWDSIESALPKNTDGTVIVTSRRSDLANSSGHSNSNVLIHHMQPLSDEKASELFYKKAFPKTNMCHVRSEGWSKNILQRCEGLPGGITEIGQSLSNSKGTEAELKEMYDKIGSSSINGHLSDTVRVLSMSYKDVPPNLQYCLLYLSIFPEGFPIDCRKLVRLWIAEGFIPKEGQTIEVEQIGEGYLKELINWNLVKICTKDFDGGPRSCRLHNFMHKIILVQSRESTSNRSRRFSVQDLNTSPGNFTSARTIIVLDGARSHPMGELYLFSENISFLKVLELDGVTLDNFPSAISGLLLLRYLSLRSTGIKLIPDTIGNLQYLETLDLKYTLVTTIPDKALAKLTNLRNLFIYSYRMQNGYVDFGAVQGFEASSSNIIKLNNLRKLAFVKASHELVCNLRSLTGLRKLGIIDLQRNQGRDLCSSIELLSNLCSLNISSLHKNESLDLCSINSPPPFLRRLYLKGRLEGLPTWISQLHDLARVRLKWSKLKPEFNPFEILGCLPNLLEFQLLDAYEGQLLYFRAGQFRRLQVLDLEQLRDLRTIIMDNGTLPQLSKLIIKQCSKLVRVADAIYKLIHLNMLVVWDMPPTFVNKLKIGGQNYDRVRHIPHIQFIPSTV